jgi:hypothetical protein
MPRRGRRSALEAERTQLPLRGRVKGGLRAFCSPAERTLDAPKQRVTLKHGRQAAHLGLPAMQAQAAVPHPGNMPNQPTHFSKEPNISAVVAERQLPGCDDRPLRPNLSHPRRARIGTYHGATPRSGSDRFQCHSRGGTGFFSAYSQPVRFPRPQYPAPEHPAPSPPARAPRQAPSLKPARPTNGSDRGSLREHDLT